MSNCSSNFSSNLVWKVVFGLPEQLNKWSSANLQISDFENFAFGPVYNFIAKNPIWPPFFGSFPAIFIIATANL